MQRRSRPAPRGWQSRFASGGVAERLRPLAACLAVAFAAASASGASAQVFEVVGGGGLQPVVESRSAPLPSMGRMHGFGDVIRTAAARYGLAPELLDAVAWRESGYRIEAVSPAGAVGVMQLMPGTARRLGVDPHDPVASIFGGAAYLRGLLDRFNGRIDLALAAYNAGPEAVQRHGGVPPYRETRRYVAANLDRLAQRSLVSPSTLQHGDQP
jgi:soluble lytic murein transglycosylase-like protein